MVGTAGDRDGRAWVHEAVERFEGPLTLYASRLLGDAEAARDVVQDTFLKLCGQPQAEVAPHLAEWLYTVCRNRALDVLRKDGRKTSLSEEAEAVMTSSTPNPAEAAERSDEAGRALRLLDALPPSQREVIRLRFQHDFSYREISTITGHSVTNVGYLLHMGLKTLRAWMADPQPAQPATAPARP